MLFLLALALTLVAVPAFAATSPSSQQGVQINSLVQGTLSSGSAVSITFTGSAAHTVSGQTVVFNVKQLVAATSPLGPLTASLDPSRASTGTLSSPTFPAVHRQNFFLLIKGSTLGTLVSDLPLTLSATIQSSPPTATYRSVSGNVVFYRQGDPNKQPVLTVQSVSSDVKPAATQTVNISSLATAVIGTSTSTIQFTGSANNLVSGQNVLFIAKNLTAVNPGPLGATTLSLDSRQSSDGTLGSSTFPTTHTQNFYLQINSQNLGTLVADKPVTLTATIQRCPPIATYKSISQPVAFYRQGDPTKQTVLTIQSVTSDVTPPNGQTTKSRAGSK
jgi:hypothetical protein